MIFDARKIAKGWLSVALASATDDSRPALYRTVAIESFPEGVRLIATDKWDLDRDAPAETAVEAADGASEA